MEIQNHTLDFQVLIRNGKWVLTAKRSDLELMINTPCNDVSQVRRFIATIICQAQQEEDRHFQYSTSYMDDDTVINNLTEDDWVMIALKNSDANQ